VRKQGVRGAGWNRDFTLVGTPNKINARYSIVIAG
jgi:hypothetical protein